MRTALPIDFLRRLRTPLTWAELTYAYENGFVDGKTIIEYACDLITKDGNQSDDVVALACSRPTDSISGMLGKIVGGGSEGSPEVVRRWAFILSSFVSESERTDKLSAVEEIYDLLDYPVELAQFVRYMPMTGPDLGSVAANEQRMLNALRDFSALIVSPVCETAGQ